MLTSTRVDQLKVIAAGLQKMMTRRGNNFLDRDLAGKIASFLEDFGEEETVEEFALCLNNGLILESTRTADLEALLPYTKDGAYIVSCLVSSWEKVQW